MKLETFFDKFGQFADAPDAVAKMRELVLQLAVTGKLVTQDKRDEPALALLESAEVERAKLIAAKKIKSRPTSPVESNEQPFDLPLNWAWARLSDVGYELGQKVPDKRFTYIDVGGIDSDKGRISDRVEKLEPGDAPSRARKLVARGTVIYSTVRPYLRNIAIVDQDFDPEPIASTAFGILHPFAGINNRYLFYWLRSAPFTAYVQAGMKGMAYPAINDEKFYSGFIPLPPLTEQKRIVAKVDELMALCDRLDAQQQEREIRRAKLARSSLARFADAPTPANLPFLFHPSYTIPPADLRKSILTLAVQGKLVPQDPNDETAENKIGRNEEMSFNAPFEIPKKWTWTQLSQLADINGGFAFKSTAYTDKGTRVVRISDFDEFGFKDHKVVRHPFSADLQKFTLEEQNILMAMTGGTVGKSYFVRSMQERMVVNQRVAAIKVSDSALPSYVDIVIRSEMTQEVIRKAKNSTNDNISMGDIKGFAIPLPPLSEQRRVVAKVEQLMALVDALETQLAASRDKGQKLLEAIVSELTLTS